MDPKGKKIVIYGAAITACTVASLGAYYLLNKKTEFSGHRKSPKEDEKNERSHIHRRDSLRGEELRYDLINNVIPVDSYLKDANNREFPNPMVVEKREEIRSGRFLTEKSCIPLGAFTVCGNIFNNEEDLVKAPRYKKAGPRNYLYYNPNNVKAAIVTCGGICPGINVVIREIVMMLWYGYKVREIYGIKYGYKGFWVKVPNDDCYVKLIPNISDEEKCSKNIIGVNELHSIGGSILGTSRGGFDGEKIVDELIARGINQVYAIGGDGTHRGLKALSKIIKERGVEISLVGIPKTIDNDIDIIDKTFGFDTAVEIAMWAIQCADVEANSAEYGVGLVKIMGRYAGHIAMHAALSNRDVNICLIPESPFDVYGPDGLLEYIMKRLKRRNHCIIVMAEGVGAAVRDVKLKSTNIKDLSGNIVPPVNL